ncbi:MAG TPA: hypothetical protein VGB28_02595, partial [Actinomycetota bacterium]
MIARSSIRTPRLVIAVLVPAVVALSSCGTNDTPTPRGSVENEARPGVEILLQPGTDSSVGFEDFFPSIFKVASDGEAVAFTGTVRSFYALGIVRDGRVERVTTS